MFGRITKAVIFIVLSTTIITLTLSTDVSAQQNSKGVRTLYLIRHGDYAPQNDKAPDSIMVLNPLGIAQARLVTERLISMNINFHSLVSSTMTRARQTAGIINRVFPGLKLIQSDLIRE